MTFCDDGRLLHRRDRRASVDPGLPRVLICPDMREPYSKVIQEKCSEAPHILDRFHIVSKMNKALDEVRAEESRPAFFGRCIIVSVILPPSRALGGKGIGASRKVRDELRA